MASIAESGKGGPFTPTVFMFQPESWEPVVPEDEPEWRARMEELIGPDAVAALRSDKLHTWCRSWESLADDCDEI